MDGNQFRNVLITTIAGLFSTALSFAAASPHFQELTINKTIQIDPSQVFESTGGYWRMNTVQRWDLEKLSQSEKSKLKSKNYVVFMLDGTPRPVAVKNAGSIDESYSYSVPPALIQKGACWMELKSKPDKKITINLREKFKVEAASNWVGDHGLVLTLKNTENTEAAAITKIYCSKNEKVALETSLAVTIR